MGSLQLILNKHWDELVDTVQVNDQLIRILKANRILSLADFVHLCNCKSLMGNTVAAQELLRILALTNGLSPKGLKTMLSLAKQHAAVKLLREAKTIKTKGRGRRRRFGRCLICCGCVKVKGNEEIRETRLSCAFYQFESRPLPAPNPYYHVSTREGEVEEEVEVGGLEEEVEVGGLEEELEAVGLEEEFEVVGLDQELEERWLEEVAELSHEVEEAQEEEMKALASDEELQHQLTPQAFPLPHINARYYYDREHVLGTGRTSQVFLGYRDKDPELKVAVKWVYKNHCTVSPAELDIGKQIWREMGSPTCANVVPVYDWSMDDNAYFIVMELAVAGNLYKAIYNKMNSEHESADKHKTQQILENCVNGVRWLHEHGIIHNEVKPENILLFRYDKDEVVAKIGDFGISHRFRNPPGSGPTAVKWDLGVESWMSPELKCALYDSKPFVGTQQMDIYSLGVVYRFCLRDVTEPSKPLGPTWENLLRWMMKNEPRFRPTISQVGDHPAFWNEEKCLTFLEDVCRCFSNKKCEYCLAVRKEVNDCYKLYHRTRSSEELDWKPLLQDSHLLERIPNTRNKTYETDLIFSLVELIRDKAEHYQEMRKEVKVVLFNNSPYSRRDYAQYFLARFPYIVINLFCKLASIVNARGDCLASLKKEYFMRFLDMDHSECWSDDENIYILLNGHPK